MIVVASAGNDGPSQYITGSPASATGAISVAAVDSTANFPGVTLNLGAAGTIPAINANAATITPQTLSVVVLKDDPATTGENEALGCSVAAYQKAGITAGGNQLSRPRRKLAWRRP